MSCRPQFTGFCCIFTHAQCPRSTIGSGDPEIQRSDGARIRTERGRSDELGKAAFHWAQTGGEVSDKLRLASRTATNPPLWPQRDLDERLNGRAESRRSGIRAPATVVGGFVSAWAEKGPVQTLNLVLSVAQRGGKKKGGGAVALTARVRVKRESSQPS